jgi:hypothetical protein
MTRVRLLELKWYILAMFNVILPCLQGIKSIIHSQKMITSILFEILWLFGNLTMIISFVSLIILLWHFKHGVINGLDSESVANKKL